MKDITAIKKDSMVSLENWEDGAEKYKDLIGWLDKNIRFASKKVLVDEKDNRVNLKIFTENYCYSISARLPNNNDGYLGCIATARKPRTGETWTRGRDLPDGNYSEETFNKILAAIVSFEILPLEIQEIMD